MRHNFRAQDFLPRPVVVSAVKSREELEEALKRYVTEYGKRFGLALVPICRQFNQKAHELGTSTLKELERLHEAGALMLYKDRRNVSYVFSQALIDGFMEVIEQDLDSPTQEDFALAVQERLPGLMERNLEMSRERTEGV